MGLDELHARRLATVINVVEGAIERIEMLLQRNESPQDTATTGWPISAEQIHQVREKMESVQRQLQQAVARFGIQRTEPEPRQVVAAELSALWVTLENAMPKRMTGYGRQFDPQDKHDWEQLIQSMLRDVEQIRKIALDKSASDEPAPKSHYL